MPPDEYFPDDHRRNKALEKVTHLIIIVPRLVKNISDPIKSGHHSIGVMPANEQYITMKQYEQVSQICEPETPKSEQQRQETQYCRENFQYPGKIIVRVYGRDDQPGEEQDDQKYILFHLTKI